MATTSPSPESSRTWLSLGGILFVVVVAMAMASPLIFTSVLVRFLAIFILFSGAMSLALGILGKHQGYRWLEALSSVMRIAAGIALLMCLKSGVMIITLVVAIYLIVEGLFVALASFKLRPTPGWSWTLINGIAAVVPGIMVYTRWPSSNLWVLGMFFGITLLFKGAAQLALGLSSRKPLATAA